MRETFVVTVLKTATLKISSDKIENKLNIYFTHYHTNQKAEKQPTINYFVSNFCENSEATTFSDGIYTVYCSIFVNFG